MKKRTLFLTLTLTMAMSVTSLTGCGTQAKATYDENAIVEETPTTEEDTMKEEVVVAGEDDTSTTEDASNETVSNDDSFVVLQQRNEDDEEYIISMFEFEDVNETKTTSYEIPVYCEGGYKVGYIKAGSTFTIIGQGKGSAWSKLENPIKGTEYDYLYVNDKYVPAEAVFTQDEVLAKIQERFSNKDMGYELLDAPESDMQKAEFSVSKEETIPTSVVDSYLYAELHLSDYTKFYIEENGEDADNYNFVIYYKDLYQAE